MTATPAIDPACREDRARSRQAWWVVFGLTLVAAALRIATINTRSLWLDEAISVEQASRTLPHVLQTLASGVHPPLYHTLMHFWMLAFGTGEIAIRGYALVWGLIAIPCAYWAASVLYNRRAGLVATVLLTFSPYHIWYSQEARMYSMMMVFGLLTTAYLGLAVRDNKARHWVGYGLSTFGGLFTHYFFLFVVIGQLAYFVLYELFGGVMRARKAGTMHFRWLRPWRVFADVPTLRGWLFAWLGVASLFVPWLTVSILLPALIGANTLVSSATGTGLGYGQSAPSLAFRLNDVGMVLAQMTLGFHPSWLMYAFVALWPLTISAMLISLDLMRPMARRSLVPLCSASGMLVILALGQWQGQVLASRYFMGVAAPVLILLAGALSLAPRRMMVGLVGTLVAFSLVSYVDQSFNSNNMMHYDNRQAVNLILKGYEPGDVVIYEPFYLDSITMYYIPDSIPTYGFPQYGLGAQLRNGKVQLGQDLRRVSAGSNRVWLLLSFQDIVTVRGDAYNTTKWFLRNGYRIAENHQLSNVQLIVFEARDPEVGF